MTKEKEREAWKKVLSLYKEMSYMYDKNHREYFNRHMRQAAFKALLQVYNEETGKDTILADFKKKLENLRTTYYRELKKVYASKQTGSGSDDVYKPTLWYYHLFDFLEGITTVLIRTETDPLEETQNFWSPELEETSHEETSLEEDPTELIKTPPPKKQKIKLEKNQEMMLVSTEALLTQKKDDWEIIGKSIGVQMRNLSTHQQVIVQKLISDAIFYGKLGKLTDESHITLSP